MVLRYARTGTRSWSIGGEQVLLKPFRGRRASEPEKSKTQDPIDNRRKSMIEIPPKPNNPLNQKADYYIKLIPDSPPIIECGLPPKPKPVRKNAGGRLGRNVEVSFTFVIGGYKDEILLE